MAPPAVIALPPLAAEDHVCDPCGISYQETTVQAAVTTLAAFPERLRAAVSALDPDSLATRPQPGTWSPLEYLCHLRDVLVSATIRLYRSQTEDTPAIEPMFNDLRAARFHYNRRDVAEVLSEITDNVDGFLEQVKRVKSDGWPRRLSRLPGEYRTACWLVRQTMHEAEHHLRDIVSSAENRPVGGIP